MTAIKTTNLCKKYKTINAVDNLNLEIQNGEMFSLLGVNGAGKTTAIKMLSCLIKPTSGEAQILDNSIVNDSKEIKKIISVSPQETAVAPNLSVFENLELMCRIHNFSKEDSKQKAIECIKEFNMEEIEKSKAKTLSGGWQRRLSIAMALITEPKVLFLDEPTLGLDVLARRELWSIIKRLKGKITIILTTHYLEEAEALSDRIAVMKKGELQAVGTVEELLSTTNSDNFEDAFIKLCGAQEVE